MPLPSCTELTCATAQRQAVTAAAGARFYYFGSGRGLVQDHSIGHASRAERAVCRLSHLAIGALAYGRYSLTVLDGQPRESKCARTSTAR
jgi:hypothetical protein